MWRINTAKVRWGGMNVKYLMAILLSSVISALTVFILLGRLGQNESEGRAQPEVNSPAKARQEPKESKRGRRHREIPHSGGTSDSDKSTGGQKSGALKQDVRIDRRLSDDSTTGSNSHKPAKTIYVTRKLYRVNHIGSATTATSDGMHGEEQVVAPASVAYISDPVNPQPGMIANVYAVEEWMDAVMLQRSNDELPEMGAVKTFADKSEMFSLDRAADADATVMLWDGFIKCKRAGTYTISLSKGKSGDWNNGYSMRINNDLTVTSCGANAIDADFKVGWNRVEIVCQFGDKSPLNITYKPKESLSDPRPLAPGMMFHDRHMDESW